MYDDNERDFWHDEPTRRLGRLPTRQVARVERTRQHIPVITTPARASRHLDPFLVRVGVMLCLGAALVPVAFTLRHGASDVIHTATTGAAAAVPALGDSLPSTTAPMVAAAAEVLMAVADTAAALEIAAPSTTEFDIDALPPATPVIPDSIVASEAQAPATTVPTTQAARQKTSPPAAPASTSPRTTASLAEAPMAEVPARAPTCAKQYDVVSGDYWILIAKKVGVSVKDLLAANNATVTTALYPGRTICLPNSASAPTTTDAPSATSPARTTLTTAAPTTTTLPHRTYTAAEIEAIIRDVWPDELEDEAVRIARRESNLQPTARNSCCIGLFQIYWTVHKGWLTQLGITTPEQLFDPRVNATAGLALYQRSGGWGPWAI